jgi:hypothetical protein
LLATACLLTLAGCANLAWTEPALANPGAVQCPPTISTLQQAETAPAPWKASQQGTSSRLLYVEVYAGPWRDGQALQPDHVQNQSGTQTERWHFKGTASTAGTWLVCSYQNTQVKLERRLPDSVSACQQTQSTDPRKVVKLLSQGCE